MTKDQLFKRFDDMALYFKKNYKTSSQPKPMFSKEHDDTSTFLSTNWNSNQSLIRSFVVSLDNKVFSKVIHLDMPILNMEDFGFDECWKSLGDLYCVIHAYHVENDDSHTGIVTVSYNVKDNISKDILYAVDDICVVTWYKNRGCTESLMINGDLAPNIFEYLRFVNLLELAGFDFETNKFREDDTNGNMG